MVNKTSKFIPNTFQYPNAYVDQYMAFLTPNENVVLTYAIRRIIGFQKAVDRISISQFTNGLIGESGERLDYGTGLGVTAVRTALKALVKYRLMKIVKPADPERNLPPEFGLQWDSAKVDAVGLEQRRSEKKGSDQSRTVAMREAPRSDGQTRSDGQHQARSDGQTTPGLTDETHNIPVETQKKTRGVYAPNGTPPKEPTTAQAMFQALADVCGYADLTKLPGRARGILNANAKELRDAGYSPEFVRDVFGPWWYRTDFRGQKKQKPTPAQVVTEIGRVPVENFDDYEADLERRRVEARKALEAIHEAANA